MRSIALDDLRDGKSTEFEDAHPSSGHVENGLQIPSPEHFFKLRVLVSRKRVDSPRFNRSSILIIYEESGTGTKIRTHYRIHATVHYELRNLFENFGILIGRLSYFGKRFFGTPIAIIVQEKSEGSEQN